MNTERKERLRAAIGPRSEYYLGQFEKLESAGDRWVATWNWPAFFFSCGWFAYRRMGSLSLLNFFLPILFILVLIVLFGGESWRLILGAYAVLAFGVLPAYANQLYYRHLARLLARVAASAEDKKAKELLRPPSFVTGIEAFFTAVLAPVIPSFLIVAPQMYADYTVRSRVSEGIAMAYSIRQSVTDFYEANKRLPAAHEAEQFRLSGGRYIQSVAYDAGKRMIMITTGERLGHKRLAIRAEEKDGRLSWTCRTIDLEQRYLPPACRD